MKRHVWIFALLSGILLSALSKTLACDIRSISPITDKILLIQFNEGHIDYTGLGESNFRSFKMYYQLLDLNRAMTKANYSIQSTDDATYGQSGISPVQIGRKAKMAHVGDMFDAGRPDYLSTHYIYIELPIAMTPGKTYTLVMNNLASNSNRWTFVFDPAYIFSETIHVNQIGFTPNAKKYAYLSQFMGDFNTTVHQNGGLNLSDYSTATFRVLKTDDNTEVFAGPLSLQKGKTSKDTERTGDFGANKNFTNADVWQCDFSALTTPGRYKVVVDRMGCSFPFEIKDEVYNEVYYHAMRALFFQRAGIFKEVNEYNNMVYPASYLTNKMYKIDKGRGEYGEPTDLTKEVTGIWGWYYDAGDWDGILHTHSKVPAMLLMAYEMYPEKFKDGDVGNRWKRGQTDEWTDEGTNGIPDMLDEARWLIDFMKRAREALVEQGAGTGGVPSYVGVNAGSGGAVASWTDARNLNCTNQDVNITATHAGLAGWLSACLAIAGRPQTEVDYYKNEAISAYTWAKANGASGDELQFAAAGLYRATGETTYQNDYISNYAVSNWEYWAAPEWDQLAACMYALLPADHPNLNSAHQTTVREGIKSSSDNFWVTNGLTRGFRATHFTPYQRNFMGAFGTPRTLMQAVTAVTTGETKYEEATHFAADYCMGGNPINMVWMSGIGHRFDEQPFHPDSWCLIDYNHKAYTNPILPGFVSYGTHYTCDWWGCGFTWEGDEDYSRNSAYPAIVPDATTLFPQAEARFQNRVNIPGSEYTIHQTILHAIFTYGILKSESTTRFLPNSRPEVSLLLAENQDVNTTDTLLLEVEASDDVQKVEYYYDWKLIGTSYDKANGFAFNWVVANYNYTPNTSYLITAKAYDDMGMITVPTAAGEKTIRIVEGQGKLLSVFNTNGTVSRNPDKTVYSEGEQVTLTAIPSEGYLFTGWGGDATGTDNPLVITMNTSKSITAQFISNPVILSVTHGTGSGTYAAGAVVEISANAAPEGKIFDKWTGDVAHIANVNAANTTVTMPASDISLTATYKNFVKYYNGSPIQIPGKVKLEEYDNGGEGVAYHDADPTNGWALFRTGEGVDINEITIGGADYFIGNIAAGEWINYSIDVLTSGTYDMLATYASGLSGGSFHIKIDGTKIGNPTTVSGTGGWKTFQTKTVSGIPLTQGEHTLTVYMESDGFNLKDLTISPTSTNNAQSLGTTPRMVLYPNPVSGGSVSIAYTQGVAVPFWVEIHNLAGGLIFQERYAPGTTVIIISDLKPGVYQVAMKTDTHILTARLIVL